MSQKITFSRIVLLFLLQSLTISGQSVRIDGEVRSRIEYRDGFKSPLADTLSGTAVEGLRTRIQLDYADDKVKAKITLQDSRMYGETGVNNTKNSLGVFEAWGSYRVLPEFSVTLGRQAIEYDDKRLITVSNWSNTGNAHDLLLLKYELPGQFKLHLGSAWNNSSDNDYEKIYNVARSYKALTYIWFGKSFGQLDFSAIGLNDVLDYGTTDAEINKKAYRNTLGGNVGLKNKDIPVSFYATVYYQFGHDAVNHPLNAYLLALNAQYKINNVWSLLAGCDYFSGTSTEDVQKGKDKTFNKLYGSNHAFNGSMEYWTTLPAQGLWDGYGGVAFKPNVKFDVNAVFHSFAVAKELPDTPKKSIGSEIDFTANYTISPQLAIQGGWSAYFKNEQTDILKKQVGLDTHFPQWAFVMLTFKPKFFNTK
ncbi:MAG: alginate export family protein [Candidatus Symbiothrix sp.]|jgi:hypothetical protein|nr:alginate export family protein [Candidatus Symbiothrix sp.]